MRLFAPEMMHPLKEHAKATDLSDPFSVSPAPVKLTPGTKRAPVVERGPLSSLGF
jgi:hypothetical protein